jgi:hypothetical protein
MTPIVQVGTVLIGEESIRMTEVLALQSEPYFKNWSVVKALNDSTLDDKIRAVRWHFFFLADEVKATFFGAIAAVKIQGALQRIARKVKQQKFNCLEVTGIVAKRFLGVRSCSELWRPTTLSLGFSRSPRSFRWTQPVLRQLVPISGCVGTIALTAICT